MTKTLQSLAVAALALGATSLFAEIELTKEFSISGYVAGSATYQKYSDLKSDSNMDIDAYKLQGVGKFDKVSITGSLFAFGAGDGDGYGCSPIVLDAYGTYDFGNGYTVTAGKFLSSLGYEAFDVVGLNQISYSNSDFNSMMMSELDGDSKEGFSMMQEVFHFGPLFGASIPGYHTGLKVENRLKDTTIGVAVVDSLFGSSYYKGDGDIDNGLGFEAYVKYTGVQNLTLFGGLGYERQNSDLSDFGGNPSAGRRIKNRYFVADFWAEYVWNKTTFGAEFCWTDIGVKTIEEGDSSKVSPDSYFWSVMARHAFTEKWAATFRISETSIDLNSMFSEEDSDGSVNAWKFTFAPSYAVTKNLDIVAEYSYTYFDIDDGNAHGNYLGLQTRFKF